jgi:drug/metabolite transporter (DMT)-like permease
MQTSVVKYFFLFQLMNVLFSFAGVMTKFASLSAQNRGPLHPVTVLLIGGYLFLMMIYAFFWQIIIRCTTLSTAYLSKGLILFWTILWAFLIFNERIGVFNILGVLVIIGGTILVNNDN